MDTFLLPVENHDIGQGNTMDNPNANFDDDSLSEEEAGETIGLRPFLDWRVSSSKSPLGFVLSAVFLPFFSARLPWSASRHRGSENTARYCTNIGSVFLGFVFLVLLFL